MYYVSMTAATQDSGARGRTRRAILDAAVRTLAADQNASLGDIAEAADVGRTTLHRYFPERTDLIAALDAEATSLLDDAVTRARLDNGPADKALVRLALEYLELGDMLNLVFNEVCLTDEAQWSADETSQPLYELVVRGHAEGAVDPAMPPDWVDGVLWSVLYMAWMSRNDANYSRQEIAQLVERSLSKLVAAP